MVPDRCPIDFAPAGPWNFVEQVPAYRMLVFGKVLPDPVVKIDHGRFAPIRQNDSEPNVFAVEFVLETERADILSGLKLLDHFIDVRGEYLDSALTGSFRFLGATLLHILASGTVGVCLASCVDLASKMMLRWMIGVIPEVLA